MEIIRYGTDIVSETAPRGCCYPAGTWGIRIK